MLAQIKFGKHAVARRIVGKCSFRVLQKFFLGILLRPSFR